MEITSISSFLDYYGKIRARTNKLIKKVPSEHLDFTYKPGKFTIADQIRHIATIERYMFAETIAGRKSAYPGCGKELADGYDTIINYFSDLHRQSLEIFSSLTDADLTRKCITPDNTEIAVWKWLRAMVEHEIHHRAQLYLYLNMLNVSTPPIFGLTAEEVQSRSIGLAPGKTEQAGIATSLPYSATNADIHTLVNKWLKAWTSNGNHGHEDLLLSFYTEDCFYSDPQIRNGITGKNNLKNYFKKLLSANPSWKWEAEEIIPTTKGCTLKWKATIPVGKEVITETGLDIVEFRDGLICRNEVYFDRQVWLSKVVE